MVLDKRYYRNIKHNLSFYVSATILTITTLVLFFMMNIAGNAIKDYGNNFFDSQNLEDANFTTYIDINEEGIENLITKYNVELEKELLTNIDTDGVTTRVFKKTNVINLYEITVGEDIKADNEVIISEGFAVAKNIKINDTIKIGHKEYIIKGFFLRPDYLYMIKNETDAYKNVTTFFLAYMSDDEFDKLDSVQTRYLVRFNESNEKDFRKEVNEKYAFHTYSSSANNQRITMVSIQAELYVLLSYVVLLVAPVLAIIIISLIISRKVKSEQKIIGTLTAFGINKRTIMSHYVGFAAIPGMIGGIFTVLIAGIFSQSFGEIGLMDYEPMRIMCHLGIVPAILGVAVPTLLYIITAIISVNRLIKKNTIVLLNGNANKEKKKLKGIFKNKRFSFKTKYAFRSLLGNPARTLVIFLGLFLGSFIVLLGFGLVDSLKYTMNNGLDEIGSYKYIYLLNELTEEKNYNGEGLLMLSAENSEQKNISIMGCNPDNQYLELKDINGEQVDLSKGYYVTSSEARLSKIKKGDIIKLYNPLTLEEYEIEISGIINNDMQRTVYMSLENAIKFSGINSDKILCNAFMSGELLNIEDDKVIQIVEKEDSEDQIQSMLDQMGIMILFVIVLGIIICVASVYVSVNMLVTESRSNIAMLKVLGYNNKKISNIILSVNHILLPFSILLSVPMVYLACNFFLGWLAEYIGMFVKSHVYPISIVYAAVFTSLCYFGSLFLLRKKATSVNMVESLKDNRE